MSENSSPKVSVVVPSYNRAEFIEATLVSIQNQSFKDFEVVFVDDGSTDNTAEIVKKFCDVDPRFRYLKQENSERAVARAGFAPVRACAGDAVC